MDVGKDGTDMNTVVTCQYGILQGVEEHQCVAFYSVPYAQGAGRFRYAAEPLPWQGIYDATRPGPLFPQKQSRLYTVMGNRITCRRMKMRLP